MSSFIPSLAQLKNQIDEVRAQVYPRNETEKKVKNNVTVFTSDNLNNAIFQ